MSFIHPLLLGGLLLVGIPVLIHLIMQQKPKHLLFPAFRFLQQRHRTTARKLRLRHLLLLALRILLVALIALALARPRLFSERFHFGGDSPVRVVLLFDTSPSMEYTVKGRTRLEDARQRAREFLDDLPDGSKVAVLDSAELGGEWQSAVARAREQVDKLQIRAANSPLTRQIAQAYRLFDNLSQEEDAGAEPPPRFLYIFSDRTQECWDDSDARSLTQPPGINAVFVDVGVAKPADLAIANLELSHQVVGVGNRIEARATVQATGQDYDTFVTFLVDDETPGEKRPIKLAAGATETVVFERQTTGFAAGPHRIEVKLGSNDALPFDDVRFATFEVRGGRKVLVLADNPADARLWRLALEAKESFRCDAQPAAKAAEFDPKKLLADYKAVCLFNVAEPGHDLWGLLESYVRKGGNLAIVPGPELKPEAYAKEAAAQHLMPGQLKRVIATTKEEPLVPWTEIATPHPLLAPFAEWKKSADVQFFKPEFLPRVVRYWDVEPAEKDAAVITTYDDDKKRPALLERTVGEGKVLLFTTGFDGRRDKNERQYWNNYLESSFYLVLVNQCVGYLAGDAEEPTLNFLAGQTVPVLLPPTPRFPVYTLEGTGLAGTAGSISRPEDQNKLQITQATAPGNYKLLDSEGHVAAGFSINARPEECQLAQVDRDKIQALLGPDSVLPLDQATRLRDALQGHWRQPVELLPWLMILLLLVLAGENLLANKFYRNSPGSPLERDATERQRIAAGLLGQAFVGAACGAVGWAVLGAILLFRRSDSPGIMNWAVYGAVFGAIFWPLENARLNLVGGVVFGGLGGALLGALFFAGSLQSGGLSETMVMGAVGGAVIGALEGVRLSAKKRLF
jgi:hypothetical protein